MKPVLLMSAEEVNTEHLLYYDKIVVVDEAMETLAATNHAVDRKHPDYPRTQIPSKS